MGFLGGVLGSHGGHLGSHRVSFGVPWVLLAHLRCCRDSWGVFWGPLGLLSEPPIRFSYWDPNSPPPSPHPPDLGGGLITHLMLSRRLESGLRAAELLTILCNVTSRNTSVTWGGFGVGSSTPQRDPKPPPTPQPPPGPPPTHQDNEGHRADEAPDEVIIHAQPAPEGAGLH